MPPPGWLDAVMVTCPVVGSMVSTFDALLGIRPPALATVFDARSINFSMPVISKPFSTKSIAELTTS